MTSWRTHPTQLQYTHLLSTLAKGRSRGRWELCILTTVSSKVRRFIDLLSPLICYLRTTNSFCICLSSACFSTAMNERTRKRLGRLGLIKVRVESSKWCRKVSRTLTIPAGDVSDLKSCWSYSTFFLKAREDVFQRRSQRESQFHRLEITSEAIARRVALHTLQYCNKKKNNSKPGKQGRAE